MNKHTPGPWDIDAYGDVQANGEDVAHVVGHYGAEENAANARLIAAAPELYELAAYAVDNPNFNSAAFDRMARAAIAKARGEE